MPSSSKPHKDTLGSLVLSGTGERTVKLGFVTIYVYSIGLYVDPIPCRESLKEDYHGLDHDGLLSHPSFFSDFVSGEFDKKFRLVFCRSLPRDKLVGGFDGSLKSRVDEAHMSDVDTMLAKLVPETGVADNDVLTITCHGDGETLTATFFTAATSKEEELLNIKSGGPGGAWRALQNTYFDDNTELPTIKQGAIANLPNILLEDSEDASTAKHKQHQPSVKEIEEAVEQANHGKGRKSKTWSEFAGRDPLKGGEGYKFGDLTLGVVTAMGMRKPHDEKHSESRELDIQGATDPSSKRSADVVMKEKKLAKLESENAKLAAQVEQQTSRIQEMEQMLPYKILCALILSELPWFVLSHLFSFSTVTLFALKMVLYAVGGATAFLHFQHQQQQSKKGKVVGVVEAPKSKKVKSS